MAPVDLNDPATFAGGIPHDVFAEMRAAPGLAWTPPDDRIGTGFWSVTRYHDVVTVSRHTDTYSSAVGHIQTYDIDPDALAARASMIDLDPPVHTQLRRLVSAAFTPRRVQRYRRSIRSRVDRALDEALHRAAVRGTVDWVATVAAPIPIGVICDLLGVPEEDHGYLIELSDHLVAGTGSEPLEPTAYGNTTELRLLPFNSPAASAMARYAEQLVERRRRDPGSDLMSVLLAARDDDGRGLSADELANFFRLLVFAGNETTRSAMSHLALHRARFPAAFAAVAADRSLVPSLVEEVIRYASPILYFRRTVTVPAELGGQRLERGDKVVMWYASANFDPSVIAEPMAFRPDREPVPPHLAFGGGGAHFCLGAALARLELAELIDEMLDRGLEIDPVGDPVPVDSNFVNGLARLDVAVSSGLRPPGPGAA